MINSRLLSRIVIWIFVSLLSFNISHSKNLEILPMRDNVMLLRFDNSNKYLLLPIQESAGEAKLRVIRNNNLEQSLDVRLAVDSIDYYVPISISKDIVINISGVDTKAICWNNLSLTDNYDSENKERLRNTYHHSPQYGWMNDPNGMFYKDGVYHLYYQYNPYGSMWGNMHWGHSTSSDMVKWQHEDVVLSPDAIGAIFSGSSVVDANNTAGYGKDAVIAYYTSSVYGSLPDTQAQSMAYSNDNGATFTKATNNPQLTSIKRDFRDPKIIWHKETAKWIMVLAVGQEMEFYSSSNLKDWSYESSFGRNEGSHDGVWECPDLLYLPVKGGDSHKWVLICNINPGLPFGGSGTQYFVGEFDGKRFINDNPALTKWMDYGKDHYATVTWSNTPDNRCIAMAWMSNWQYATIVPTKQYRSSNSVARELSLFNDNGEMYVKCYPVKELDKYATTVFAKSKLKIKGKSVLKKALYATSGAFEIKMNIEKMSASKFGFTLSNSKGEKVDFKYNSTEKKFFVDRRKSGEIDFSKEFACETSCDTHGSLTDIRLLVDICSTEVFGNDGRFVMTNIVFPSEPYNQLTFMSEGGETVLKNLVINKIEIK